MSWRWRPMLRAPLICFVIFGLVSAYLGLSLFAYGNGGGNSWKTPAWFLAGYDYAVDETLLRAPILAVADLCGRRDWNESLSLSRRMRAWYQRHPLPEGGGPYGCCFHGIDSALEEHLWRQDAGIWGLFGTFRHEEPPCDAPMAFAKDWAEVRDRRDRLVMSAAEARCVQ